MSTSTPSAQPRVLSDVIPGDRVRDLLLTVGFTLAIAAGAQLKVFLPGTPVPISAQTFVVLAGAVVLGARRATAGSALFLGLGLAGVPWFTVSSGATLGYIVGFVVASAVVGAWASRGGARRIRSVALAMLVGNVIIHVLGTTWLAIATGMSAQAAIAAGSTPFLLGDAIKLVAATAIVPTLWLFVGEFSGRSED